MRKQKNKVLNQSKKGYCLRSTPFLNAPVR